jgi:hypothetical protein
MQRDVKYIPCMMQQRVNSLCCMMQGESNLVAGSKVKKFRRLPRSLKEQSCKKIAYVELQYPIPMRIIYENSPSLQFWFDSLMHNAAGSQTLKIPQIWNQRRKDFRMLFRGSGGTALYYYRPELLLVLKCKIIIFLVYTQMWKCGYN